MTHIKTGSPSPNAPNTRMTIVGFGDLTIPESVDNKSSFISGVLAGYVATDKTPPPRPPSYNESYITGWATGFALRRRDLDAKAN